MKEFLRFFRNGIELRKLTGKPIDTMVQFDVPAMSWGVVEAATQAGVHGVFSFPNHIGRIGTDPSGVGAEAVLVGRPRWKISHLIRAGLAVRPRLGH